LVKNIPDIIPTLKLEENKETLQEVCIAGLGRTRHPVAFITSSASRRVSRTARTIPSPPAAWPGNSA